MPTDFSGFISDLAATAKSVVKIALSGRRTGLRPSRQTTPLIILGNGPSLRRNLDTDLELLQQSHTLAVNFAANTPEFALIRPDYYVLADPHFFTNPDDPNVRCLICSLQNVEWELTLFIPATAIIPEALVANPHITVKRFNFIAAEGFGAFEDFAFRHHLGMPRPRNVLIPSIMLGIWMGYTEIYILGADHSWIKTLSVDEDNRVVSIQPHFYREDEREANRIKKAYLNLPLHSLLDSFRIAFQSYHRIQAYASRHGVKIFNSTPDSFIDAFQRAPLPSRPVSSKD